jgi:hypothetical protein
MTRSHVYISTYYWMKICEYMKFLAWAHAYRPHTFFQLIKKKKENVPRKPQKQYQTQQKISYIYPYTTIATPRSQHNTTRPAAPSSSRLPHINCRHPTMQFATAYMPSSSSL